MFRVLCDFGYREILPYWHVVLPLVSLIFLSIGLSFASSRKMKLIPTILVAIIFVAVADVIAYFMFDIIYSNVTYQGVVLSERFKEGTTYPIVIYSYGFMLMVAFVIGTVYLVAEGKREGYGSDVVLDMMTFVIVGSIIGARIIYVLLMYETEFAGSIDEFGKEVPGAPWWDITRGGLSIHGGIAGAMLSGLIFCKIRKLKFWKLADFTVVAVPLGIFFGRVGCYLNGCCYGIKFDNPDAKAHGWWTVYPTVGKPDNVIPPHPLDGLAHHPAPLYMAIAALVFFFWLRHFRRNKARFAGHTFLMFIFLYSVIRFVQEMYRFDESSVVIGTMLTIAQLASIIIAIVALFIMVEVNRRITLAEKLAGGVEEEGEEEVEGEGDEEAVEEVEDGEEELIEIEDMDDEDEVSSDDEIDEDVVDDDTDKVD